jgi:hypothetical protein
MQKDQTANDAKRTVWGGQGDGTMRRPFAACEAGIRVIRGSSSWLFDCGTA